MVSPVQPPWMRCRPIKAARESQNGSRRIPGGASGSAFPRSNSLLRKELTRDGGRAVLRFPDGRLQDATAAAWMSTDEGDFVRIAGIGGSIRTGRPDLDGAGSRPIAFELLSAGEGTVLFWTRGFVEVP